MIGILDSGVGGLVLARVLSDVLADYDIIFFGDTARGSYVNNSPAVIRSFALEGARFLIEKGAHLIVIACHDISSTAVTAINEKFPGKIIDSVTPSIEQSLKVTRFKRVGVIGTPTTIESGIYEKKIKVIQPETKVYSSPCPLLSPIVEEGWFKKPETNMIVKKYIQPLKIRRIDTLIAACSYYSPLCETIGRKVGKRVKVIDSSIVLADYLVEFLKNHPDVNQKLSREGFTRFFVSDISAQIEKTAKRLFRKNLNLEQVIV
jgi:glutamate racemase